MFGLKRNAVIGLNLYCGGAKLGASGGGGDASPSGKGLLTAGKEAAARREAGGGEAGPVMGGSAGASPPATLAPDARRVARPSPIGAEGPDVTATPTRLLFAPVGRASLPEKEMEAAAADAIMSPEEELDGYEPEPLGKRPAVLPLLELVGEAGPGPGAGGSLPSTPPPAEEEEEDELFRQSLEIISRYLREQATGAKDAKPLGGPAASSRKALETLRRVGDGVQRNHEMAFQGMLRKLDIKNEDDVKSLSRVMVHVFSDGVTNWGRIVTLISFGAFVAKHLKSINQESCIDPLAESITDVLVRTKRDWLVKQRGWDGFVEFFHVEDLEGGIRNVLLAFAGVAGVGAGLAYLIR
ncbi:induced myeloid leukemia cell differentiation protein Mcl-1 isoform X1 [Eptesicus fuscus]|uniref:induced myeloid leukemia cell differentiation protein Mcl-1 isoform X1 n=1 Tax=Eptesicus fuscus TaxID=29078 RepID=UPI00046BAA44|nr:induced myeloid leukemia cell differentiation protein Mcl-1 isoform X1 [Eptesicus fuscus]